MKTLCRLTRDAWLDDRVLSHFTAFYTCRRLLLIDCCANCFQWTSRPNVVCNLLLLFASVCCPPQFAGSSPLQRRGKSIFALHCCPPDRLQINKDVPQHSERCGVKMRMRPRISAQCVVCEIVPLCRFIQCSAVQIDPTRLCYDTLNMLGLSTSFWE